MNPLTIELVPIEREANARWLHIGDMRILISYATPVAFERGSVQHASGKRFSKTTGRHVNRLCKGWHRVTHDVLLEMISDNLLVIIKELKGNYDIVHESRRWNGVLADILDLIEQITDQDWTDVEKLKEAVAGVQAAALSAMIALTGVKMEAKVLFPMTKRGTLVKALADMAARGELKPDPAPT